MSYKISKHGGWGDGSDGSPSLSGQINNYAAVTAISGNTVTIGTPTTSGQFGSFAVGQELLIHASSCKGAPTDELGVWDIAKITGRNGNVLTLSKTPALTDAHLANYNVQVVSLPNFDSPTISGTVSALAYDATTKYGGILAFKCRGILSLAGGKLDTLNKGIPVAQTVLRPAIAAEMATETKDFLNGTMPEKLVMNRGNGIVVCLAKALVLDGNSRFGATAAGVARTAGGDGGATVFVASENVSSFTAAVVSTAGVTSGVGKGRCLFATPAEPVEMIGYDEILFGHDLLHDGKRLRRLGIRGFGDGRLGDVTNPVGQISSYARVTAISADGKTLTIGAPSNGVYERFETGAMVLFHVSACLSTAHQDYGKFRVRNIVSVAGSQVTLDEAIEPSYFDNSKLTQYACQLVTIPQFRNLTLNGCKILPPAYDTAKHHGGIFAAAILNRLDSMDSRIGLTNPGGSYIGLPSASALRAPGIAWQTNATTAERLPFAQGGGIAVLLGNEIRLKGTSIVGNHIADSGTLFGGAYRGSVGFGGTAQIGYVGGKVGYSGQQYTTSGHFGWYDGAGPVVFAVCRVFEGLEKIGTGGDAGVTGGYRQGQSSGSGYGGGGSGSYTANYDSGGHGSGTCHISIIGGEAV